MRNRVPRSPAKSWPDRYVNGRLVKSKKVWGVYSRLGLPKPAKPYHWTVARQSTKGWTTWMIGRTPDSGCLHGSDGGLKWCFRDLRSAMALVNFFRRRAALWREQWAHSEQAILLARAERRRGGERRRSA